MTLTRAILNDLKSVREPYLTTEQTIFVNVNVHMSQPVTLADVQAELKQMAVDQLAVGTHDAINRVTRWKLTPEGRLA